MRNPENCGYPDGQMHGHVDNCHRAGVEVGRRLERNRIVAWLREQANVVTSGQVGDQRRAGALNHAADRLRDGRSPGRPEDVGAA